jgi:hypothetical protein
MFLRTARRRNADGKEVVYFQLAENVGDAKRGCTVARIVDDFGRADRVAPEALRRWAHSVLRAIGDAKGVEAEPGVTVRDAWPYGGVWVLERLWTELGVGDTLRRRVGRRNRKTIERFERAIFAMVTNRALEPYSKLYCWEQWLREEVFLPGAADRRAAARGRARDHARRLAGAIVAGRGQHRRRDDRRAGEGGPARLATRSLRLRRRRGHVPPRTTAGSSRSVEAGTSRRRSCAPATG